MDKPKLYIINPHLDDFLSVTLSKGKNFNAKYGYLIKSENWKDYFSPKDIFFLNTKEKKTDINAWINLNKINENIKLKELRGNIFKEKDIVIISSNMLISLWRNFNAQIKKISQDATLIITINHYMWKAPILKNIFKEISTSYFICERSPLIYSRYLEKDEIDALKVHKIIEIPYVPNQIFRKCRKKSKLKKCAIVGQCLPVWRNHIFYQRTGFEYFHKIRRNIKIKFLNNDINLKIFDYFGPKNKFFFNAIIHKFIYKKTIRYILKILKIYNLLERKIKFIAIKEMNNYYKESKPFKDIFKEYSIILCGEEDVLKLPCLGFFEAMMAGCVPLGSLHNYYESLGMKRNIHYIGFDGTYEDAESKIKLLKDNPNKISSLISKSTEFIDKELSPKSLIRKILLELESD